jgi:hypothetical protein
MTFASGGNGTILHLASEMFLDEAKAKARHIPYKGVGPMVTDLIGGQVDFGTVALPSVQGHLKSGRAAGDRRGDGAARRRSARHPDLRRAGHAGLRRRGMVRGRRPERPAGGGGAARSLGGGRGVRRHRGQGRDGPAGQRDQRPTRRQAMPFFRSELAKYAQIVKKAGIEAQ